MKDTKSILLILLSAGLVTTWVFFIAEKSKPGKEKIVPISPSPNKAEIQRVQDSLQDVYEGTVNRLGAQLDSAKSTAGQLQGELNARLTEILQLRVEIAGLLKKNYPRKEDLVLAGEKTTRLQQLVSGLQSKNNTPPLISSAEKSQSESTVPVSNQVNNPADKSESQSAFTATELRFTPVAAFDDREIETNTSGDISKLIISFAVQNNTVDFPNAEVFAVVTQPDGKVIQDPWESASIDTRNGRKKYTRKVRFGYQKGETKHLQFSLTPEDYERGNYTLQVYHNGFLIGQTMKTLN